MWEGNVGNGFKVLNELNTPPACLGGRGVTLAMNLGSMSFMVWKVSSASQKVLNEPNTPPAYLGVWEVTLGMDSGGVGCGERVRAVRFITHSESNSIGF